MAEAIVSTVIGRLTDLLIEDAALFDVVKAEIEEIVAKLGWMKTFLRNADSRINEERVRLLVADIRELAYDAENVIESFLLKASSRTTIQWINTNMFSRKIRDIKGKMSVLSSCFDEFNITSTTVGSLESSRKLKRFYTHTTLEPEIFVGFKEDVDRLVGHLVNESDDCYPLISICGMGGLGKTTLAQKIYNHSTIKTYFAGLAWVSISQKWQTKEVLQRILICLAPEEKDEILSLDDEKLAENLLEVQQRKKCLIVLDDIWSTDAWDSLKPAFAAHMSVSKLMLTTRKVDVAEYVNPKGFIHKPESLSAEQSWELLQLKALTRGGYLDIARDFTRMEELGREMLKNCGGLPLAVVLLGGILVTKPSLSEWEKVYYDSLKKGKGMQEDYERQLFDILVLSYNDLSPQLKPCFLYLGKYSEDYWIEAETLYQLWIAEGLVLSSDKKEGETMMQVAESYMGELVHKSMVQVRFNDVESSLTKFKSCSLHDLMRDLSISQAKSEDFFKVIDLQDGNCHHLNSSVDSKSDYTRQLVVYFDKRYTRKKDLSYFMNKANYQRYRSMLFFNEFTRKILPPVLGSHVANFRLLRVFSLEERRTHKSFFSRCVILGRALGNLVHLRYLSVRGNNLLIFPLIDNLLLLQTLKLDGHRDLYFPPWHSRNVLGKMSRLQHLYLPKGNVHGLGRNIKLRLNGLSKLETLENCNSDWCEIKDLPKLTSLQKLILTIKGSHCNVAEMMKYLAVKALSSPSCLRYLAVTIDLSDPWVPNGPDIFQPFWSSEFNFQDLTIYGQLPELTQLFGLQQHTLHKTCTDVSFVHMTSLFLLESRLKEDPMPVLEKIPTLCKLTFSIYSYLGKEMVCTALGFPKLTHLYFWDLINLEIWRAEDGSMPNLSYLELTGCGRLSHVSERLRSICHDTFFSL